MEKNALSRSVRVDQIQTSSSGVLELQVPQEDRVDHAEDGGVCANPDGEGKDANNTEGGTLAEKTDSVAKIVHSQVRCNTQCNIYYI